MFRKRPSPKPASADPTGTPTHSPAADVPNPSKMRLALIMVGLCLAVILTGMDQTILATATPVISNDFHTIRDLGWWSNAYLLTLSSLQLLYGTIYTYWSIKTVHLAAIVIFELGTLICTVAPNSLSLIVGRAIAGAGAAGIFSGSLLITAKLIPMAKRAAYLGIMSAAFGLAAIIGPFIGGALTDKATWRWCFGINLPLGVVTVVVCAVLVQIPGESQPPEPLTFQKKLKELDIPGTVCIVASCICLLIALQWGGSQYPWSDGRVVALLVVFALLAAAFVVIQSTSFVGKARTIPSSLARNRDVWLAASYAICIVGGVYIPVLYLPIWFETVHGYSALRAGSMLTPLIASYVLCSVVAGGLTTAIGYYNPGMIVGTVLAVIGSALLTTIGPQTSVAKIVGFQLLYGSGVGFGFGQPTNVVQTLLPSPDIPVGVTLITLVQNLSASVFVAIAQATFQGQLSSRLHDVVPDSDVSRILSGGISGAALTRAFYISLALTGASVVGASGIRWTSMKKKPHDSSGNPTYELEDH